MRGKSEMDAMRSVCIIGAGRIGHSIARLLLTTEEYSVLLIDSETKALDAIPDNPRLEKQRLQGKSVEQLSRQIASCSVVVSACGYAANPMIARAATAAGISYFDLTEDIRSTSEVARIAMDAKPGQVFVPQCGLAPGFIGMLGYHMSKQFERLDQLKLRVGALPEFPTNNLMYNLTWSTEGLINEYCNPCHAIRSGQFVELTPLEGLETFSLDGISYEAFNTSGGLGTLCETLKGKVSDLTYKSIRYKGHQYLMNFLINDLKLGDQRDLLKTIFENAVAVTKQDLVLVLVTATGIVDDKFVQLTDCRKVYHGEVEDELWGAIQITTASSLCAMVDLFFESHLPIQGYIRQEQVDFDLFMSNRFASCFRRTVREPITYRDSLSRV